MQQRKIEGVFYNCNTPTVQFKAQVQGLCPVQFKRVTTRPDGTILEHVLDAFATSARYARQTIAEWNEASRADVARAVCSGRAINEYKFILIERVAS